MSSFKHTDALNMFVNLGLPYFICDFLRKQEKQEQLEPTT